VLLTVDTPTDPSPRYTFGDDVAAVARLQLVASAYEPVSRSFLAAHTRPGVDTAMDLGCGPGFSTRLVGEVCRPARLVGVDASHEFLGSARARVPTATFVTHDVTTLPLPGAPAAVIYARLVLAHLPDPAALVQRWTTQLGPGGTILVEDLEDIDAPPGALRRYDEVSAQMVRRGGGLMYAGAALAPLGGSCVRVTVTAARAARIYLVNTRRWLADPTLASWHDELIDLEHELAVIAAEGADHDRVDHGRVDHDRVDRDTVSWIVRQVVLRG
jgi:SAM-dependent methyltransferase